LNTKRVSWVSLIILATLFVTLEVNARLNSQNKALLNELLSNVVSLKPSQVWGTGTTYEDQFVIWEGDFLEEYGNHIQIKLGTDLVTKSVSSTFFVQWLPPGFNPYGSRVSVQRSKFLGRVIGEYEYFNRQGMRYHSAIIEPIVISDADFDGWESGSFYHADYFLFQKESYRDQMVRNCLIPGAIGAVFYYLYKYVTATPKRTPRR